jgi:uncharacterized membrane protein
MSANDRLVSDYLDTLDAELAGLPRVARREVLDDIEAHIRESLAELDPGDEVGARNVLDRIGEPSEIAAEARERFGIKSPETTWREVGALILLSPAGLIVPVLGWFAGVILLWVSDAWNTREKLFGTFFPLSVALVLIPFLAAGYASHLALLLAVLFASLLVVGDLLWKLAKRTSAGAR